MDSNNLERAVLQIAPEKASNLTAKYRTVMDAIDLDLTKVGDENVVKSKSYLEQLANELIDSALLIDNNKSEDKRFMVQALDLELDNIADNLGIRVGQQEKNNSPKEFVKLHDFFTGLHIDFPIEFYENSFRNISILQNLDLADLVKSLNRLYAKTNGADYFRSYLHANQGRLLTAVGQFCNGFADKAFETVDKLQSEMSELYDPALFNSRTGLNLSNEQVQKVMSSLLAGGVDQEEIFRIFTEIKEKNSENFTEIKLDGDDMVVLLVSMVLNYKNNQKQFANLELLVESKASRRLNKQVSEIAEYNSRLNQTIAELNEYHVKNPERIKDNYVISTERNITVLISNIRLSSFQQFAINVQRFLAMSYVENNHKTAKVEDIEKVIASIFAKSSIEGLRRVAGSYNVNLPPDFGMLEKLYLDFKVSKIDLRSKEELQNLDPENKRLYEEFYAEFLNGKVDTAAKRDVVLHQIYQESQDLANLSDENESIINRDREEIYGLIDKYGFVSKIPTENRDAMRQKAIVYLEILLQGQSIAGKLLATYINAELLDPKLIVGNGNNKVSKEIAKLRQFIDEIKVNIEDLVIFLEKKDIKIPEESEIAQSPLYAPILASQMRPFNEKYSGAVDKVLNSSNNLGIASVELNKYLYDPQSFDDKLIPYTRIFRHALNAYGVLENDMVDARKTTSAVLNDLKNYRAEVVAGKVREVNKYPYLAVAMLEVIDNSIAKAEMMLNDVDSPISDRYLSEIRSAKQDLEIAYDNQLTQDIKQIAATTIIIAAAVAGGITAYGLLSRVGVQGLIYVSAGSAAGGTLASRAGMHVTNALNLTEFSTNQIWDRKTLVRDFMISWGMSIAAIGSARLLVRGLNRGAASTNLWIADRSKEALEKLAFLQKAVAPSEWFGLAEGQITKGFLKKYGLRFGREYGEEVVETSLETVNPLIGFVASMINSADGINARLPKMGIDADKVKAGVEGQSIVYRTATAEEFVANMESYFAERGAVAFKADVHADGNVRLTVEDHNGRVVSLDVKPGKTDLEPSVELRRINGIKFDQATGTYRIELVNDALFAINDLCSMGFVIEKNASGIRAVKGNFKVEIGIDQSVMLEIQENLQKVMDDMAEIARMASEKPSPALASRLRLKLAGMALTMLTLIPRAALAKSWDVKIGEGIVGTLINIAYPIVMSVGGIILLWKSRATINQIVRQITTGRGLGPILDSIMNTYSTEASFNTSIHSLDLSNQRSLLQALQNPNLSDIVGGPFWGKDNVILRPLVLNLQATVGRLVNLARLPSLSQQQAIDFNSQLLNAQNLITQIQNVPNINIDYLTPIIVFIIWLIIQKVKDEYGSEDKEGSSNKNKGRKRPRITPTTAPSQHDGSGPVIINPNPTPAVRRHPQTERQEIYEDSDEQQTVIVEPTPPAQPAPAEESAPAEEPAPGGPNKGKELKIKQPKI